MSKDEIEGSAARIADRGRDTLFEDNLDDNALNSLTAVDAVVRSFAEKVVGVRSRYNADKITDVQAREELNALAAEYAAIFMGQNAAYVTTAWNTPELLGEYLASVVEDSTPETSTRDFLLWVAAQLLAVMIDHENGAADDEVVQFRVDTLVEDAVYALLGLPNTEVAVDDE